jgi:hypothetical protein
MGWRVTQGSPLRRTTLGLTDASPSGNSPARAETSPFKNRYEAFHPESSPFNPSHIEPMRNRHANRLTRAVSSTPTTEKPTTGRLSARDCGI